MRRAKLFFLCILMLLMAASCWMCHEVKEPERPVCKGAYVELYKGYQVVRKNG